RRSWWRRRTARAASGSIPFPD
ncbi:hypothetical protein TGPRC2_215610B, partial [Toxoplasma gondii TgCatPRC2]